MPQSIKKSDFNYLGKDKIRYSDLDVQGHVNNAVYSSYLETGRTEFMVQQALDFPEDTGLVIVRLELDFLQEMTEKGQQIEVGTRISSLGNSTVNFEQAIFVGDQCTAFARIVAVYFDQKQRKSIKIEGKFREQLQALID
ncbi:thioesterase family protein [Brackiella oedipodis]|uniref:thioesterase family protein n=1 Tax=Brackiella oedipodis TaxID=124225 RepID=UPI00048EC46C